MSVSPLDLQILYSNLKNIGQQQAAERAAEVAQQDKEAEKLVKKADQEDHRVLEAKDIETGVEKINEEEKKKQEASMKKEKDNKKEKGEKEKEKKYFEDPDIGHHIDISG